MTSIDELRRAVDEDDGSLPERWNADDIPGTTVVGTVLRYEQVMSDYGEGQLAIVEDEAGKAWNVALFRTVLKKRFDTLNPLPGDTVGVKYVGVVQPRGGANPYHNYVVRVMRGAPIGSPSQAAGLTEVPEDDGELPF